ncbi:MAG: metal-dependent hydrolase [Nitrososphaeria archaeon]
MVEKTTHIIFAFGLSINILWYDNLLDFLSIIVASFFGTILPDWDLKVRHRKILHNVFVPIFSFLMLILILKYFFNVNNFLSISFAYLTGYLSHLFLDLLTGGVALLYPIKTRIFTILKTKYNNFFLNFSFTFFGIILIYLKIRSVIV